MKSDAAQRKFDQLLVWKVSRLGRDMREVLASVYAPSDLGIVRQSRQVPNRPDHVNHGQVALYYPGLGRRDGERSTFGSDQGRTCEGEAGREGNGTPPGHIPPGQVAHFTSRHIHRRL
jgi:hypothetical protein